MSVKPTRISTTGRELTGGFSLDASYSGDDVDITTGLPLDGLLDVNAPAPDDNDVLTWDDGAGEWIAAPGGGGPGGSLPWYDVTTDGACVGDGATDDTVALQAAIDDATASGTQSATLYFPPGTYLIGGALQDTGARNAQILLPTVSTGSAQITIRFLGAARPPFSAAGSLPDPGGYSIIESSLTGASGTAACIGGGNQVFTSKNNISVGIESLICVGPANPTFTFWNLMSTQGGSISNLMIATTQWTGWNTQPTHSNAYGIRLPQRGQSNYTHVDGLMAGQFYTGVQIGEMTVAKGLIHFGCKVAVELTSAPHASQIIEMHQTACTVGIHVVSGSFPVSCDVLLYDNEHYTSPAWAVTTYDLDDPDDALYGHIRWRSTTYAGPVESVFNVNGGANSSNAEIGALVSGSGTPATTVTDETTLGITPAVGADTEYARQDHTHGTPSLAYLEALGVRGELVVADGTSGEPGLVPTSYVEMTTQRTTTSATLVDITGATTTITLQQTGYIAAWLNCEVSSSGAAADLGLALSFDGVDEDTVVTHLSAGAGDSGVSGIVHRTTSALAPGTYTVKGRFKRSGGAGTPAVDRADLLVMGTATAGPALVTTEDETDYVYADLGA